ncbi:MAG: hypothetical protein HY701_14290, partial [Gemmatimonadetes bacterium]|nr:hypothetical protein [Gemmatimonadota bacterium]
MIRIQIRVERWVRTAGVLGAIVLLAAGTLAAQTTSPSSLRYGSGYFDIPTAGVLPHMGIAGTYSGFGVSLDRRIETDPATGRSIRYGGEFRKWMSDASVGIGLFDRVELGVSLQSFSDSNNGGTMAGGFGQVAILQPERMGIGLAAGGRFVTSPTYDAVDPNADFQPPRLGFPDSRVRAEYQGPVDDVNTTFSPYAVTTAYLPGLDVGILPRYDVTVTLGYGLGQFRDTNDLTWYSFVGAKGWFGGGGVHVGVGQDKVLHLLGEWNGFDVNAGAQLDYGGVRVGAYVLGANYLENVTEYRSMKFGVLGSVAFCPAAGALCKPRLLERARPDTVVVTVQGPPARPDTVLVTREVAPPLPTGSPANICLATGEEVQILITAQSDTLVGPQRVSTRSLRPGVVFAGTYGAGREWFTQDQAVRFENRNYNKFGQEAILRCAEITRVGEHQGVPLFAPRDAQRPFQTLYVPARPGIWQPYQFGVGRTR